MELLATAFSSLVNTVVLIPRQLRYLIYYRSNLEELKRLEDRLVFVRDALQHRVDAAVRNGEMIEPEIMRWLEEVDEIMVGAASFSQDERHARARCSSTSFPNLRLRHQFGRKSKKMVSQMDQLLSDGRFGAVSYRPILPQLESLGTSEKDFHSRVLTPDSIMESLEDPNLNMIGVYGLGGVGKTTLVREVATRAIQKKSFDVVAWVTVSNTPELRRIQQEIAESLGLRFEEENVYVRAARLSDRLMKEKSVLIILDDVWEKLDLHKIGIPDPKQNESLKILVTSRSREVLYDKMEIQKCFSLTTLSESEAWMLFKVKAGLEKSSENVELLSIATEVAAKCAGLPLAIVTLASALKGKDLAEWKYALRKLQVSSLTDVTGMSAPITESMQDAIIKEDGITEEISKSLERLEKDATSIFYLCGLTMGDNLATSDLFKYSVGLGLFEDTEKMTDVRNRFNTCISKLEDLQLLQESNSREFLAMNDVIQDVAISLAYKHQRHFMIRHQEGEKWPDSGKLENCTAIILSDHDINEHPEGLNCQNLIFFQLLNTDSSLKLPDNFLKGMRRVKVLKLNDNFFKEMPALKVLDLTAVKFLNGLPSSIIHLEKLTTLCLDYCVLEHMAYIGMLKDLKNLKILSLSNSSIEELPHEIGQLTQLQFLDLSYCFQLEVIPPNVFSSLKKLEELYMLGSFDDWDVNDPRKQQRSKASIFELTNLPCLTTLEVNIPDERMLPGPEDMKCLFGSLKRGKVLMGRQLEFREFFRHETSAALKLWLSSTITENVERLLASMDYLGIGNLEGAKNIVPQLSETGFPQLKYLCVRHNEIQYIADPSGNSSYIDLFPVLDSLVLHSVRSLEKLCSGPLMRQSFSRLKFVTVKNCSKLKGLFSFSLVRGLPHLLEIDLGSCYSMVGIVSDDGNAANGMLQFPKLRNLYLKNLPELVGFCCEEFTGNSDLHTPVSFFCDKVMSPNLEILDIKWTKNLKTIWQCSQLLSNCFGKLTKIDIRFCVDLIYIFPYQIISTIPCKILTVAHCECLRGMVSDDGKAAIGMLQFPELRNLYIENLPELIGFRFEEITGNNNLDTPSSLFCDKVTFPNLEILDVKWTKNLQTIWQCSGLLSNCFGKLTKIDIRFCVDLVYIFSSQIISTIPCLETLTVAHCESLQEIVMREDNQEVVDGREIVFSKLKHLELDDLSSLRSFSSEPTPYNFPSLVRLIISKCPHMKMFCSGVLSTPVLKSIMKDGEMRWEGDLNATIQKFRIRG